MKSKLKSKYLLLSLILLATLLLLLGYTFFLQNPSNNRNWETGMEILPQVQISGDLVTIQKVRDFRYEPDKIASFNYTDRIVNSKDVEKVWFVVEPFTSFPQVAHTYFVFDIKDQDPIVVSVEARREKGEDFNPFLGLFNKYELIYIWGTETDETIRRAILERNELYMYPLQISRKSSQELFLYMAQATQSLQDTPRFYNTLLSNCTSELAKSANKVKPGAIPFDLSLIFPGYATEFLFSLGYLPKDLSLEELKQKYAISDIVQSIYQDKDFSARLRSILNSR